MPLILPVDSDIRPQDLTLDFYLEATPVGGGRVTDMTGKKSYTIQAFTENLGFGITSVDIDIKPSLQPVVNITFKDLYGNLVFNKDPNFNFDVLFQLPYPKFTLYVKGYTGKPVSFLLQVKSVKTTFQPSDGSYEIKAEFVPNVFGFFGDIPYQYLFAVGKLKDKFGEKTSGENQNSSIIQIAKNGVDVRRKISQVEDKYKTITDTLNILASDSASIASKFNEGVLKFTPLSPDQSLISNGFTAITFNLGIQNEKGQDYPSVSETALVAFGDAILASINSPKKLEFKSGSAALSAFTSTDIGKKQIQDAKTIITANLQAISKAATSQAYNQVEEVLIDSQTIYNVMTRLAGDCAYILGYILEGGLNGFNNDTSRLTNNNIFGNYYPLVEENSLGTVTAFGEQKPWPNATIEMDKVKTFVKALSEGVQEAQVIIDAATAENEGTESQTGTDGGPLAKRITNAEVARSNPYNGQNADNIVVNLIQRAGLLSCGYAGQIVEDPNKSYNLGLSEQENFKEAISKLRGAEKAIVRTFAEEVSLIFEKDGKLKKQFTDKTKNNNTLTYEQYFTKYFEKFPLADNYKNMFLNSDPKTLVCKFMLQNNVMYYNPKEVFDKIKSKNSKANNVLNKGGKGEIIAYFENGAAFATIEQLNGDVNSDTQIPNAANNKFFQFFKVVDNPITSAEHSIFLDYTKMVQSNYEELDNLIVKCISGATGSGTKIPKKEDYMFKLVNQQNLESPKDFVTSLKDPIVRSYLANFANNILKLTAGSDAEQDKIQKQKAEEEKKQAIARGEPVTETTETTTDTAGSGEADIGQINAVYTQFHHICQAWLSLANVTGGDSLPSGTDINLRTALEAKYRSVDKSSAFYLNFSYPLLVDNPSTKLEDAIINTDPLLENNAQTSTLNMMQNICTLNNFLLQPIPGGFTDDLKDLFKPIPEVDYSSAVGRNALSIIWSPTPENRIVKNDNSPIYPDKNFLSTLNNLTKDVIALRFGSPNNVFLKSVKAGTDDNKVTSESLQATSDIVNNQNQNKRKGFDCSMLAVMQGRSYKIGLDILGNAQIFPTMNIAIDGLPIFTGLYWVTEVQHKLTPNTMETSIEAVKMKYGGDGKNFAMILPITKRSLISIYDSGGSSGGGGNPYSSGFEGGGDLNVEFLKRVKDIKIKNTNDINNVIKQFTSGKYSDFVTWFNSEIRGKKPLSDARVDAENFKKCWDLIIPIEWPENGDAGINFLEFVAIHCIIYNETGGTYKSKHENMNSIDNGTRPGIAYAFDKIPGKKKSYNENLDAGTLFNDPQFIAAHGSKPFGNDNKVARSSNPEWKGAAFPKSLFPNNIKEAAKTEPATFINEADFYKFAGRGYIQTTWRGGYKRIVEWILTYNGDDTIVKKYKSQWAASPYNSNTDTILTRSSNKDWDELFTSPTVIARAMVSHANAAGKYQYIKDLTAPADQIKKAIYKVAYRISGSSTEYPEKHRTRVYVILDTLYPAGATNISNTANSGGPQIVAAPVARPMDGKVIEGLIKLIKSKSYKLNERAYEVNMVGIRSETTVANKFDDRMYIFWKNEQGKWEGADYPITTDPGTSYLKSPMEEIAHLGTAILKFGQWKYKLGYHSGKNGPAYKALNPDPSVNVKRDNNRDNILDYNTGTEGKSVDINIHRSSKDGTSTAVNNWSAGCQVFANGQNFAEFMQYVLRHVDKYGNSTLYYSLIDNREFTNSIA